VPKPTFLNLPEAKRQRVLDAAMDEFGSVPFEAASLNRIVKAAGIAKGSFYQYFEDLFDLYRYLVLDHLGRRKMLFIQAQGAPPSDGDVFDQLEWAALQGVRWGISEPQASACAAQLWQPTFFGPLKALQDELRVLSLQTMRAVLEAGQASGSVRQDIDLDVAAALLGDVRTSLDAVMKARLGFTIMDLCTQPELAERTDLADVQAAVRGVMDHLRRSFGTGRAGGGLDLDGPSFRRWTAAEE
jgi:AcrR family transcriptional regulator